MREFKCQKCSKVFRVKRPRKTCSLACAQAIRSKNLMQGHVAPAKPTSVGKPKAVRLAPVEAKMLLSLDDLPSIDTLPAAYVKRVAEYWAGLVGVETRKRID